MTAQQRLQRLRAEVAAAGLDGLLVTDLINIRYLSGFTGSFGELLVTPDGRADALATDGRYTQQAAEQVDGLEVLTNAGQSWIAGRLPGAARLGLEDHSIPWARVSEVRKMLGDTGDRSVVPASGIIEQLRQVKDHDEVAALAAAARIADEAFAALLGQIAAGMTERAVATTLDRAMVDGGATSAAFDTIVAAGGNGAKPHHRPDATVLQPGDVVTLDFGALVDGYHSDMTRVVCLGEPPAQLRAIHEVVHAAQAAGVAAVTDGAETAAVDAACRDVVSAAGYGDRFVHGTGHGVGLQIHEDPYLRPLQPGPAAAGPSVTLRNQMTVTVEPGVYVPGLGGVRIEDSLVVTPDGAQILTMTPKELVIL